MGAKSVLIELIYISSKVYLVFYLKKNGDAVGSGGPPIPEMKGAGFCRFVLSIL